MTPRPVGWTKHWHYRHRELIYRGCLMYVSIGPVALLFGRTAMDTRTVRPTDWYPMAPLEDERWHDPTPECKRLYE